MAVSVFDLFKIGLGPSSSHTVGPMKAGLAFSQQLANHPQVDRIVVELYGSLALTGVGHGTDRAVCLGLAGYDPATIPSEEVENVWEKINSSGQITSGERTYQFKLPKALVFHRRKFLEGHPNALKITGFHGQQEETSETYYSVGGGHIITHADIKNRRQTKTTTDNLPYPFASAADLLSQCRQQGLSIAGIVMANEKHRRSESEIHSGLQAIWSAMVDSIRRGCEKSGTLPGKLQVKRRAAELHKRLQARAKESATDPLNSLDWLNLFALAVNEENAAGAKVVTAPTNGAAGIIPSVLKYIIDFGSPKSSEPVADFLLTATAIGSLYVQNASISGAEVGCQGEVGVACSMAAGALAAILGGTPEQVEMAAEIGMEHNLGLTCDPVGGLVQIPCIERNAMASVKAVNAARIALMSDGTHHVSLDSVIKTMQATGLDMRTKYKETSRGGLAVNVTEC